MDLKAKWQVLVFNLRFVGKLQPSFIVLNTLFESSLLQTLCYDVYMQFKF